MAQQIKKKFLSPEVISYFDNQIDAVETAISTEQAARELGDSNLQNLLNAEAATREASDTNLASAIGDLSQQLTSAIGAEAARAQGEETAIRSEFAAADAAKLAEAKAYTDAQISAIPAVDLTSYETIANVDSKDAAKLVEAKAYTDAQIAAIPPVDLSGYYTKTEVNELGAALQGELDTEKARIDAILSASTADKDSFKEIVDLINSVDTENDSAFAGYVLSNDARVLAVETDVSDLDVYAQDIRSDVDGHETRIAALEAKTDGPFFDNEKHVVGAELGFIELTKEVKKIMSCAVGRMAVHEGEDFTVSVVDGKTRLTWINSLANPSGEEKIETGDNVFVVYAY